MISPFRVPIYVKELIQELEENIDESLLWNIMRDTNEVLNGIEHIAERQQRPVGELLIWYMSYVSEMQKHFEEDGERTH